MDSSELMIVLVSMIQKHYRLYYSPIAGYMDESYSKGFLNCMMFIAQSAGIYDILKSELLEIYTDRLLVDMLT